jgi:POT family proton-dependent oligopeptide transporter
MTPQWGFVIAACTALVLLLAFGGIGVSMQLERARGPHTDEAVEGVRAVLRILIVFAMITPFWSLFDQKASTWIVQANSMDSPLLSIFGWEFTLLPAQMQAVNPILVLLLIPFNNVALFPLMRMIGITPTPLRRMGMGIALSAIAWIVIGLIQLQMDGGDKVSILWQLLPYALLTLGEVLVSATGLEFAYSQAPAPMKGIILSFWYLAVTVGNLWVLIVNSGVKNDLVGGWIAASGLGVIAFQMFFFAAFALLVAAVFALYAMRYKMVDNYRSGGVKTA